MKRALCASASLGVFLLLFSINACTGTSRTAARVDVRNLLTAHEYQMQEIRILQTDKFFYYKRGNSDNTAVFDREYIKFNEDGTGYYHYYGEIDSLNWDFVNGDKTRIQYTLHRKIPVVVNWESINFSGRSISYSEYYTLGEIRSMASGVRTVK